MYWLFLIWEYNKQKHYEHLCTDFYVSISFYLMCNLEVKKVSYMLFLKTH